MKKNKKLESQGEWEPKLRTIKNSKKIDYWKPFNESMFDCCWCASNCSTPCARNQVHCKSKGFITMSLFGPNCKSYVEKKAIYQLTKLYPRVDPLHPQRPDGHIIEKEVELTPDDYGLILDALYEQACYQEHTKGGNKRYAKDCRKVANKFERIFKDEKYSNRKM